jgi:hypothetical protein
MFKSSEFGSGELRSRVGRRGARIALGLACALLLAGCSVNVKKEKDGNEKQVDIKTLVGGIHVSKGADISDVGLTLYPGAVSKEKNSEDGQKNANVNISGFGYELKVAALEYRSDDAPDKVQAFYREQLKKFGSVLVCHTSSHVDVTMKKGGFDHSSHALACENSEGDNTELKVGTKDNQHIVAIEPDGKGSSFTLVYVRTHGKETDI